MSKYRLDGKRTPEPKKTPEETFEGLAGAFKHFGVSAQEAANALTGAKWPHPVNEPKRFPRTRTIIAILVVAAVIGAIGTALLVDAAREEQVEPETYATCPEGTTLTLDTMKRNWECAQRLARAQTGITIGGLPRSCDPGRVFWVTDGVSKYDCQAGGGSMSHWCVCDSTSMIVSLD